MQIYIARAGNQQGPYSLEELNILAQSEPITGDDQCWYEGCAEWIPLSQLPGFISAPPPSTTAAPEVFPQAQQPTAASPIAVSGSNSPKSPLLQSMATASPVPVAPRALNTAKRRLPLLKAFIIGILVGSGLGWKIRDGFSSSGSTGQGTPPKDVLSSSGSTAQSSPAKGQSNSEQHQRSGTSAIPPPTETVAGLKEAVEKISRRFFGNTTKFQFGAVMVSTGGLIPAGTKLYPVRFDGSDLFFFQDEFGEWNFSEKGKPDINKVSSF